MINIYIISIYSFPNGMAATNRMIAYAKGMTKNGANVNIVLPFPSGNSKDMNNRNKSSGTVYGIHYKYTSRVNKSRFKAIRAVAVIFGVRKIIGYITSGLYLLKQNRKEAIDSLFVSTDSIPNLWFYGILGKFLKVKRRVFIFDEYPIPIRHKLKTKIPLWKKIAYKIVLNYYTSYISISQELADYFNKIRKKNTHILPIIVDTSRFIGKVKKTTQPPINRYLCYMGNMELSKDDVDNIIKAFSIISKKYKNLNLKLYGAPNIKTKAYLLQLIESLGLKNIVQLMGRVESSKVPSILQNAYVLLSSQPDTVRASGGFPTKLGEYLSTGVPALLTNVGENSKYVKDGEHVFFSKPNDPNAYAKKLSYILDNYEEAKKVAENGRNFLIKKYSYTIQGKKLLQFLEKK